MTQNAACFFVDRHAHNGAADRIAILDEQGQVTYGELACVVNQVGNYLKHLGVQPEQRVVLHLHDGPQWVFFFMAAIKIGAVAVPVNTFCNPETLAFYLNDSRAAVLVTNRQYSDDAAKLTAGLVPLLQHVVHVDDEPWKMHATSLESFNVSEDDSAFWLYTSGSTGVQKAVVHSHGGMLACAQGFGRDVLAINDGDRTYSASKLFFAYGLGNSVLFPFSVGATSILSPRRSDPDTVVRAIAEFKPTLFFAVPTLYAQLLTSPQVNRELFAGVRMCVSAGEPLQETLFASWRERTAQLLYEGIGTTETLHIFCANRPGAQQCGTSGLPVDGYELRIVDAQGLETQSTDAGRLLVRGATLAKGYWNRREAQRQAFLGEWLATGDIYQRTGDGYFSYIGRQDDAFKSSGLWVSPGEIEQALLSYPHAREAAVVAVRNPAGSPAAKAFVVLGDGEDRPAEDRARQEIYRHLEDRLSRYKIPASIEFLPVLPRTATGKVSRAELRRGP